MSWTPAMRLMTGLTLAALASGLPPRAEAKPRKADVKSIVSLYRAKAKVRLPAGPLEGALQGLSTGQVDAFIREANRLAPGLPERVAVLSHAFLGVPYRLGPLGEGAGGAFDTDPLMSFEAADCVTFVEQVLAMSMGADLASAQDLLRRIRYRDGLVRYKSRNHFTEADWLPNNIRAGFLEDITEKVAGADVRFATKTVDKAAWYESKDAESLEGGELKGLSKAEKERLAAAWREAGMDLPRQTFTLPYLPMSQLPKHVDSIPSGTVLSLVRDDRASAPTMVSHMGLFIRREGQAYFRHASYNEAVVDVPFLEYFYRYYGSSWRLLGLNLCKPR